MANKLTIIKGVPKTIIIFLLKFLTRTAKIIKNITLLKFPITIYPITLNNARKETMFNTHLFVRIFETVEFTFIETLELTFIIYI